MRGTIAVNPSPAPPPLVQQEIHDDTQQKEKILENKVMEALRDHTIHDPILAKQANMLDKLRAENKHVKTVLKNVQCKSTFRNTKEICDRVVNTLTLVESLSQEVNLHKSHLGDLEHQIQKTQHQILQLNKIKYRVKSKADKAKPEDIQRHIENLEKRLEAETKKLSAMLKENEGIKEEVRIMLRSRSDFVRLYNVLLDNLEQGKRYINGLISEASSACHRRTTAIKKIQKLQAKERKEMMALTNERHDLSRVVEFEKKKQEFFDDKNKLREMAVRQVKKKSLQESEKRHREELLAKYEQMMKNVGELIERDRAEDIIKIFIQQEAENFSLFKYVNDLNYEVEFLRQKAEEKASLIKDRKLWLKEKEHQREDRIAYLKHEFTTDEFKKLQLEDELETRERDFNALKVGIKNLFKQCRCDDWPLKLLLGDNETVNEYNYNLYMAAIEQQVLCMLWQANLRKLDKKVSDVSGEDDGSTQRSLSLYGEYSKPKTIENKIVVTAPCPAYYAQDLLWLIIVQLTSHPGQLNSLPYNYKE